MECNPQGIYRPRNAQATDLYRLVEDNFDQLERIWDERYERQHGFPVTGMFHWRPIIRHVVEQYMDCGDLRCGFARLYYGQWSHVRRARATNLLSTCPVESAPRYAGRLRAQQEALVGPAY